MPRRFRMRPWAVETGEVARPQEVAEADLGHAPETALFLDFERKKDLAPYEFARLIGQRDVGREDAGGRPAELVLAVEAKEQERHPPHPGLLEDEAYPGMAIADARQDDSAQQFGHRPHREVGDPHQQLVARLEAHDPHP